MLGSHELDVSLLPELKLDEQYVMGCTIWYHLYNLKNVKSTHGEVIKTFYRAYNNFAINGGMHHILYVALNILILMERAAEICNYPTPVFYICRRLPLKYIFNFTLIKSIVKK